MHIQLERTAHVQEDGCMSAQPIASDPWIEFLKTVDTPTLANAIELLKLRPHNQGFTPLQIRCLFPELGRMCGYAVTAQVETMTDMGRLDRGVFTELYRAVDASPKPAVIVLQEIGGYPDYAAHCGEVMATFFTRLGAVGLVSDCGVRDIPEVRALGFRYFARGAVASHAYFRIAKPSVPVQICGLVVRPGDVLHGDENGLLLIPNEAREGLAAAVEKVRMSERKLMEYVRSADFSIDEFSWDKVE
jgi:regulator of RNase E activity RraA